MQTYARGMFALRHVLIRRREAPTITSTQRSRYLFYKPLCEVGRNKENRKVLAALVFCSIFARQARREERTKKATTAMETMGMKREIIKTNTTLGIT